MLIVLICIVQNNCCTLFLGEFSAVKTVHKSFSTSSNRFEVEQTVSNMERVLQGSPGFLSPYVSQDQRQAYSRLAQSKLSFQHQTCLIHNSNIQFNKQLIVVKCNYKVQFPKMNLLNSVSRATKISQGIRQMKV